MPPPKSEIQSLDTAPNTDTRKELTSYEDTVLDYLLLQMKIDDTELKELVKDEYLTDSQDGDEEIWNSMIKVIMKA